MGTQWQESLNWDLPLQTLRNAPDALEGRRLRGGVFEIEPDQIETTGRLDDRLQIETEGLKASISKNGQRVTNPRPAA